MIPGSISHMSTASGVITLVQEHRFQLADDDGGRRLFVLAHDAPIEWADLEMLERSNGHVTVFYTDADTVIAGTAYDVQEDGYVAGEAPQTRNESHETQTPYRQ